MEASSGEAQLAWPDDGTGDSLFHADLSELQQALPPRSYTGDDTVAWLRDSLLTLRLEGSAAADVAVSGLSWQPTYVRPTLWTEPSPARAALEPLLPDSLAGNDDDGTHGVEHGDEGEGEGAGAGVAAALGFREVSLGEDIDGDAADRLALARRPMASRQGTREFVRGKIGSMPFTPGGAAWDSGGNPAAAAAAAEAATGAWLAELERGQQQELKAAAPGMGRGLFGGWATEAAGLGEAGIAEAEAAAAEQQQAQLEQREAAVAAEQQQQQRQQQKVSLDDLFSGVWLLEGDAAGEDAAPAAVGADEDWDTPPPAEEDGEGQQAAAAAAAAPAAGGGSGGQAAVRVGQLLSLPDGDQLPGGVEGDAVAAVLGAEAAAADWARKPAAGGGGGSDGATIGGGISSLGARPLKRQRGDHEWALKGHIPNLALQWDQYKDSLAKEWPFELDVFQKEAIIHMENGRSVFVAAHTSAGKTVAAEYAFALAAKHCTRAVYTSPIKTISNQKFRDFGSQFEVGLLTGDVSIKPESSCLIMTTEILRSMLYKGAELIRDIEWVVFDEVHYVNDVERGVVWEEVIIMLPAHVNLILLSATVPNVMEFADWVGRTKQKPIFVTGTTKRPVPLQHNLYYAGQLFTICQGETYSMQGFRSAREVQKAKAGPAPATRAEAQRALPTGRGDGGGGRGGRGGAPGGAGQQQQQQQQRYQQRGSANAGAAAMAAVNRQGGGGSGGGGGLRSERSQWMALIEMLRKKDLIPCVVFVFSKKRIDALADNLQSLDLTTAGEKSEIHVFCDKALARLKGTDRELPQVLRVKEMLKRGLGVHHAGLLPIVKEIVEMLFCRGVIKVLFSTETFAMGVNAPARTVIFQSLRKHDGKSFRSLLPGEYTQMAGRAGRRGLDTVGTVVIACWEELPEEGEIKKMLTGSATRLESQFRLTYSMILNLLRVEDLKVEDMLKRSFAEFHAQRAQPELLAALEKGKAALGRLRARPWPASPLATTREQMEQYCKLSMDVEALDGRLQSEVMATRAAQQALATGRVVLLRSGGSGITELGVVCSDALDAGSSSGGGSSGGGGRDLDSFFGGGGGGSGSRRAGFGVAGDSSSGGGNSGGGAAGEGGGGGRKYVVLYLHRASPLDPAAAAAAEPDAAAGGQEQQAAGGRLLLPAVPAAAPEEPMLRLKKKDDDEDLLMMGMGGGGGKKGGKKGGGGRQLQPLSLGGGGGGCFGGATAAASSGGFGGGGSSGRRQALALPHAGEVAGAAFRLEAVPAAGIVGICKVKIRVDGDAILGGDAGALAAAVNLLVRVAETAAAAGGDPPVLDPVADLKLHSIDLVGDFRLRAQLAAQRAAMACHRDPLLPEMYAIVRSERLLATRLAAVARQMSNANLQQLPEYHQRVKVLQRMGYLERDLTVTMKGRVACEVNSGDELVATEIIFGGTLAELEQEEAVALLAALVFQEKTQSEAELTPRLQQARDEATSLALQAGLVQQECGLQLTPEEFAAGTLKFGLSEVVYEWAKGTPFQQICGLTDVMEGSIVRAMVRLDETCREFRDAARVMGNTALFQQMEQASAAIKRDVIFAASLYVA